MATVSTVFRKDKLNKKGIAPVNFRVIKDRKIYYVTTDLKLTADEWDEKNNKVKPKHKNSVYWNNWLAAKNAELQNDMIEMNTNEKSLTGRQLRDGIAGKKPKDFFVFANEVCEEYKLAGQIGTYDKNRSILAKLKAYPKSGQLCFQDITPEFLEAYSQYLKTEHKNKTNTVNKDFKFIRKVLMMRTGRELLNIRLILSIIIK
ncbi:MAG: phage integrase SAM-like domain-containing protein [Bacteroidetes bacterium]|nr:phage integrase SAM-like domain-containing protein [Bacteroidota bacterium]